MNVILILGTRPQIIKSAPVIFEAKENKQIQLEIIHTGQHYDYEMTKIFFEEFDLQDPLVNLNVGSGSHAWQTAKMMIRLEKVLSKRDVDLVIVPGDTNSTLAGALTASKLHIPVAHIEAGARSYDLGMPEEINRRLTDHCSTLLFAPTENCVKNLQSEGVPEKRIYLTGDTMYDELLLQLPSADNTRILQDLRLEPGGYALLTIHRAENVDDPLNLRSIIEAIMQLKSIKIVFPIHPRTQKQIRRYKLDKKLVRQEHIELIKPVSYREMIKLIKEAKFLMTDSGGMQKEAFWLHTPCITLRKNTEWIETIQLGANFLTGVDKHKILEKAKEMLDNEEDIRERLKRLPNPFGDGEASRKIITIITKYLQDDEDEDPTHQR